MFVSSVPGRCRKTFAAFFLSPAMPRKATKQICLSTEHVACGGSLNGRRRFSRAFFIEYSRIRPDPLQPRRTSDPKAQIVENWQRLDVHPYDLADVLARLRDTNGYSQRDLARETGKSEGEISKLLALLELDPALQKMAREDQTGRITKRHLYAVRRLPAQEQLSLIRRAQEEAITASDMEQLAAERTEALTGRRPRGAPVSHRRFRTSQALVTITFRKKSATIEDLLAALDEVRLQVCSPPTPMPVSRGRD